MSDPAINSPEWLPADWTMDIKFRNGKNVKSYVHELTGQRFYSKPKVLEYLRNIESNSGTPQTETVENASYINLLGDINGITGSEIPTQENGSQSGKVNEIRTSEMLKSEELGAEKSVDWLPAGWIEEPKVKNGRTVKTYVDPQWGHRFYSKPQVLRYLGIVTGNSFTAQKITVEGEEEAPDNNIDINLLGQINGTPEQLPYVSTLTSSWENGSQSKLPGKLNDPPESLPFTQFTESNTQENSSQNGKRNKLPVKRKASTGFLPDGWTTEMKPRTSGTRAGTFDKLYIEPVTGRRFHSKQKVLKYLGIVEPNSSTPQKRKTVPDHHVSNTEVDTSGFEILPSQETGLSEQIERKSGMKELTPQGLPPGWIKEVRSQNYGDRTRNVSYFIDPVSGYVFTSQKDALRYLEAGDISKCVKKPKKREEMGFTTQTLTNADKIVNNIPSQLLKTPEHNNMQARVRFSSADEKFSSTEKNVNALQATETPPLQLVDSQNPNTFNHTSHTSTSREIGSSEQPGRKLSPEGLPSGWIKEIKSHKYGSRKRNVSYYIDPVSGYVFTSQKDALRYLEAGDISKCVKKPKKREEMSFTTKQNSPNVNKIVSNTPSQLLKGPQHVDRPKRTRFSPADENCSSYEQNDTEVVIEEGVAEGLPSGWIKAVKTEKFYIDPRSGYVFMSQKDALRYLETGDIGTCANKPRSRNELGLNDGATKGRGEISLHPQEQSHTERPKRAKTPKRTSFSSPQNERTHSKESGIEIVIERVPPEGLPPGWIKEIRIQKRANGLRKDPFYTDPVSGLVLSSRQDVLRYVETGDFINCASRPKNRDQLGLNQGSYQITSASDQANMDKTGGKSFLQQLEQSHAVNTPKHARFSSPQNKITSSNQSGIEIVIERVPPEGLPPGWIKEIRIQKKANGIRKETFYTDPLSGLVLSSQKDVFRYVETGDIRYCASKPRTRDQLGLNQRSDVASPDGVQKVELDRKHLSTDSVGSKISLGTTDTDLPLKQGQRRASSRADTTNTPTGELSNDPSEQDNPAENNKTMCVNVPCNMEPHEQAFRPEVNNSWKYEGIPCANSRGTTVSSARKGAMEDQAQDRTLSQDQGDQGLYQLGDETWSNPCLDFAMKTLTGTLPFETKQQGKNIFQSGADTSHTKEGNDYSTLLDFGAPNVHLVKQQGKNIFQSGADTSHTKQGNDYSSLLDFGAPNVHLVNNYHTQSGSGASAKPEPVRQLPNSAIYLPDMNCSFPSGSKFAPQQDGEEINKSSDKNELTIDNYARFLF